MSAETAVAGVMLLAVIAYAVLAGADFGGGVWDLFAYGPRKRAQREAISGAMAPVWEANHVWLIFVIVFLFAGFPRAYAALSIALFVPFHLVLVGITLRGAAFVFRHYGPKKSLAVERWGAVFGVASVVTPVILGVSMGAVSDDMELVVTPLSMLTGALALALCAYLAAVYLTNETEGELREDFRTRALASGTVVVTLSAVAIPVAFFNARHLAEGLIAERNLPVMIPGAIAALTSGWALLVRRYRLARVAAAAQVTLLIAGWGIAQHPYLVYPSLTLHDAAAPDATLKFILYSLPFGAALLGPSLWLLFRVFKTARSTKDD